MSGQISTRCPHCSKKFKLKNESAIGKKVPCPQCNEPFVVSPLEPKPTAIQPVPPEDDWMSEFGEADSVEASSETYGVTNVLPPVVQSVKPKPKRKRVSEEEQVDDDSGEYEDAGARDAAKAITMWIIGGLVGGVLGTLAWGGIIYASESEIAWVAWGIGATVGFGVAVAAGDNGGELSGIIAVVISLLSIFAGKVFGVWLLFGSNIASGVGILGLCSLVFEALGPYDGIWAILAGITAYQIGSNGDDD